MSTFIFFHVFICWLISVASFLPLWLIFKKTKKNSLDISYGYFWLFSSILWIFVGMRLIFARAGYLEIDQLIFRISQIVVGGQIISAACYLSIAIIKRDKLVKIIASFYTFLTAIMVFWVLKQPFLEILYSPWGTKYSLSSLPWFLFVFLEGSLFLVVLFTTLYLLYSKIAKKIVSSRLLLSFSALLIYGLSGFLDEMAFSANWELLAVRITFIISAFIAYLAYSLEGYQENP